MGIWTWEREGERDGRILNDEEKEGGASGWLNGRSHGTLQAATTH